MSVQNIGLDDCGCCEPPVAVSTKISNPAGLDAIAYRVGTQPVFKARMKMGIGSSPQLIGLTTRDDTDPAMAVVDAWAEVLDVLTFYQERIASEGYLRTAGETASVYALAAEIGYIPNPGVAADVMLAFQLETTQGSPREVTISVGTKVQSLPDPKVKPQIFEAVEDVVARPAWNTLLPRRTIPQYLSIDERSAVFAGTVTLLRPGDGLLFVGYHRHKSSRSQHWDFRTIEKVAVDTLAGTTTVTWGNPLGHHRTSGRIKKVHPERHDLHIYAMKTRAGVFGFNAPDWRNMPDDLRKHYGVNPNNPTWPPQWPNFRIYSPSTRTRDTIDLDAVYPEAAEKSYVVLTLENYAQLFTIKVKTEAARADYALSAKTTRITFDDATTLRNFGRHVRDTVVHLQGSELALADIQLPNPIQGRSIPLDRVVDGLAPGRELIVIGKRARATVASRAHGLTLESDGEKHILPLGESVQMMKPYSKEKKLGMHTWYVRGIDTKGGRVEGSVIDLAWKLKWVPALDSDEPIAEVVTLKSAGLMDGTHTRLELVDDLRNCYDRASFHINANVVHATHGETKQEVLGSGDGSQAFQSFKLKQSPLTYFSSSDPSGGTTTLKVTVDDLKWTEVATFFGQGPHDQVYVVRIAADGTVTIEFGDGITGARLPTGIENVKATYRVGIGRPGMVDADRITLLMTRPMGVRAVDNPVAAGIAADPEQLASARQNAPQKVVTFDRVVSLADFEDYARGFAGIAKAQAAWVWDGQLRLVHVTVAGTDGAAVANDGDTHAKLAASIASYGDPHMRFVVATYDPISFGVYAGIILEPGRNKDIVLPQVMQALNEAFGFRRRSLGQPVFESEVIAALQATPGVLAVDLTALFVASASPQTDIVQQNIALPSHRARWDNGILKPAQLVTISTDPARVQVIVQ